MRKFLMAAALLGIAACGDKGAKAPDTTGTMAPSTMATPDTSKKDTSNMGAMKMPDSTTKKDTNTMAPKKP